jgi:hypothetical protein
MSLITSILPLPQRAKKRMFIFIQILGNCATYCVRLWRLTTIGPCGIIFRGVMLCG